MARNVVQVRKYGNSLSVTLPVHIHRQLKWQDGQLVFLAIENGRVILMPMELPKLTQKVDGDEAEPLREAV